jgi:broad specificity phosphatase PhoE
VLVLVRHGETATNAQGRLLGRADPPLTDLGRRQAATLAERVAPGDRAPVRLVTSPLRRARETAAGLGLGLPVEVDERWVEVDYGELEGRALEEVPLEVWDRWRADPAWVPGGGESLTMVGERVRAACEHLAHEASGADVVVVSHVSPIKAAVAWALGVGDGVAWRMFLDLAAVCRIRTGPRGPTLLSFNERPGLLAPRPPRPD